MPGNSMRHSGVLAAAGHYALENKIQRLADDQAQAGSLATALKKLNAGEVTQATNMVFF